MRSFALRLLRVLAIARLASTGFSSSSPPSSSSHSENKLGDSATSQQSEAELFSDIDYDGNGRISEQELFEFVQETGGEALDEASEVTNAVSTVLSVMDGNHDRILKKDDLSKYMHSLASLLPLDEVAMWVAHAQQMPSDVVDSFIQNGITGYDFPELLQNDGRLIEEELGVKRQSLRRRLLRGMKMKLLGMGSHPSPPELLSVTTTSTSSSQEADSSNGVKCEVPAVLIKWGSGDSSFPDFLNKTAEMDFPVHKYQLYRETTQEKGFRPLDMNPVSKFVLLYEGMDMSFKDRPPLSRSSDVATFTYKLTAWNVIGRSDYTIFDHTVSLDPSCRSRHETATVSIASKAPQSKPKSPFVSAETVWEDQANRIVSVANVTSDDDSITTQLLGALLSLYQFSCDMARVLKFLFVLVSFLFSGVFTVVRVKSMYLFQQAINRKKQANGEPPSGLDGVLDALVRGVSFAEPAFSWLQFNVVAPALCLASKPLAQQLDTLCESHASMRPVANFILGALSSLLELVLPASEERDGHRPQRPQLSALRESGSGSSTSSKASRGRALARENSADSSQSELFPDADSFSHCSICSVKVTNNFFTNKYKLFSAKKTAKRKRHHCCRCGQVFCRNCGFVDHSDLMQCQVPGSCVCRNCSTEDRGHRRSRSHDSDAFVSLNLAALDAQTEMSKSGSEASMERAGEGVRGVAALKRSSALRDSPTVDSVDSTEPSTSMSRPPLPREKSQGKLGAPTLPPKSNGGKKTFSSIIKSFKSSPPGIFKSGRESPSLSDSEGSSSSPPGFRRGAS